MIITPNMFKQGVLREYTMNITNEYWVTERMVDVVKDIIVIRVSIFSKLNRGNLFTTSGTITKKNGYACVLSRSFESIFEGVFSNGFDTSFFSQNFFRGEYQINSKGWYSSRDICLNRRGPTKHFPDNAVLTHTHINRHFLRDNYKILVYHFRERNIQAYLHNGKTNYL